MSDYRAEPLADGSAWRVVDANNLHVVAWECTRDDAKVFAAAPELKEALDLLLKAVWPAPHDPHELRIAVRAAKAALDKAEGRHA